MSPDPATAIEVARLLRVLHTNAPEVLAAWEAIEQAPSRDAKRELAYTLATRHGAVRAIGVVAQWSPDDRETWLSSLVSEDAVRDFALQLVARSGVPAVRDALSAVMPRSFPGPDAAAWARYRDQLRTKPDEKIWGAPVEVSLRGLWVPPAATWQRAGAPDADRDARRLRRPMRGEKHPITDALSFVESTLVEPEGPAMVFVLGAAGMGKSSFALMLAARLAARDDVAPVLVRLRTLNPTRPLLGELERIMVADGFSPGAPVTAPRVVLLLDGFDELAASARNDLCAFFLRCRELVRDGHVHAVLLTGRDAMTQTGEGLFPEGAKLVTLDAFDAPRVREWADNWRAATGHTFNAGRLLRKTGKSEAATLHDIARYPLMLYMLARLEASGITVAVETLGDQAQVYRTLIDWHCERHQSLRPDDRWKARDMRRFLRAAGFTTMVRREEVLRLHDLKDAIRALGMESNEDLAQLQAERTLLAFSRPGEAEQTWEFAHRTFGEFLAAEQLAWHCLRIVERARNPLDTSDTEEWRLDLAEATREWVNAFGVCVLPVGVEQYLLWMLRGAGATVLATLRTRLGDIYREFIDERAMEETLRMARLWSLRPTHVHGHALANLFLLGGAEERFRPEEVYPDHFLDAYRAIEVVRHTSKREVYTRVGLQGVRNAYATQERAMWQVDLYGIDAQGCDLRGVSLMRAWLADGDFRDAKLDGALLGSVSCIGACFDRASLRSADLSGTNLSEASFVGVDMQRANLRHAWFGGCDLRDADLRYARVKEVGLHRVKLRGAKLPARVEDVAAVFTPVDVPRRARKRR